MRPAFLCGAARFDAWARRSAVLEKNDIAVAVECGVRNFFKVPASV